MNKIEVKCPNCDDILIIEIDNDMSILKTYIKNEYNSSISENEISKILEEKNIILG